MSKNLIVQYWIGKEEPYIQISKRKFQEYAERHGADYEYTNRLTWATEPYFENLKVIYSQKYEEYDKILYVDVDVIPDNMEENIFDVDVKDIGMVPEYRAEGMNADPLFMTPSLYNAYGSACTRWGLSVTRPYSVKAPYLMFNSGVILWTKKGRKKARERFGQWLKWNRDFAMHRHICLDQPYINAMVTNHLDYTELPLKWNHFPRFRFYEGQCPEDINFIHYTGGKKQFIEELHGD